MSDPAPHRLCGITWNHTRGLLPLVATAQRYSETHPGVEIIWEKRSLQAFADAPLEKLAESFDLLVIDHPHAGLAAAGGFLVPLDVELPADYLADQSANQVGRSHDTYAYGGHQWALAIDAATPVASWNPEALGRAARQVPKTWGELLLLAETGAVVVPAIPIDSLMNWYALCADIDDSLFAETDHLVEESTGRRALEHLADLVRRCPPSCLERNPIAVYEALCDPSDPAAYCPFAYGYANYAQPGYATARLVFGEPPTAPSGRPLRTTLGGTGLAISAKSPHRALAADYARYVAGAATQSGLYVRAGGQPGHRAAWTDPAASAWTNDYFTATLAALDRAYIRPRFAGYMHFQDEASPVVHRALRGEVSPAQAVREMDAIYKESLRGNPPVEKL